MAQALPPNPPAEVIVVTGRALAEPRSERVYATDVIDRRRIERSPTRELDLLLKEVPGLQLFRRSDARSSHPTSQGVTLRALGGNASSRALLVLDGVPQSDPFGGWVNWPAYDLAGLGQIRIVRGAGSVASGPGALAGTIDLSSASEVATSFDLAAGSRGAVEARGSSALQLGPGTLAMSARGVRGDGFVPVTEATRGPADERAPYKSASGRVRWLMPLSPSVELQANASAFHDWRSRGVDFTDNRTDGVDASVRLVGRGHWQWSALAYAQWRELRSSFASIAPGRSSATRASLQDSVPSNGLGAAIEVRPPIEAGFDLRLGADARRTDGESRELFSYVAGEPTRRRQAGGAAWTSGLFAEASTAAGPLTISGGARLDHWEIREGHLSEQLLATGAGLRDERYDDRSGWRPTARAGVNAKMSDGLDLRAAAYLGWRLPTLNELFRPFRAGTDATAANPDLDPERLSGVEAGLDYRKDQLRIAFTGFANRLGGAIANVTLGSGPGTFPGVGFVGAGGQYRQRANLDAIVARGVEASAEWFEGPWSALAAVSWTKARVSADGAAAALDGLRPAQTPKLAGTLAVGWSDGAKAANLVLRHVGSQYEDDLNSRRLEAATTVDVFASWPLTRTLRLVGRAENLLDALVPAAINGDGSVERATPRTLWIGVRFGR